MQGEIRLGYSVGSGLSLGHPGSMAGGADRVQHSMNQGSQAVAVSLPSPGRSLLIPPATATSLVLL